MQLNQLTSPLAYFQLQSAVTVSQLWFDLEKGSFNLRNLNSLRFQFNIRQRLMLDW